MNSVQHLLLTFVIALCLLQHGTLADSGKCTDGKCGLFYNLGRTVKHYVFFDIIYLVRATFMYYALYLLDRAAKPQPRSKKLNCNQIQFWKGVRHLDQPVDIMFPPHLQGDIIDGLSRSRDLTATVFIENVQKLIDEESMANLKAGGTGKLNWESYGRLSDIYDFLDTKAAAHSHASVISIGSTFENRDMRVLKISKSGETKPAIWIDSATHAREWISAAVITYVIEELLTSSDPEIVRLTEDFDWYILPIANPDGYEYSHTNDRMWRKTRSTTSSIFGCRGADPNRNWDYQWRTGGSSLDPCSDSYAGPSAFSEVETYHTSQFYNNIASRAVLYMSIHSYSQFIILPYGYTADRYPDYEEFMRIGQAAAGALARRFGTQFIVGNIVDLLYVASGGSIDWIKGVHDTSLTLAYELRDTGRYGFILPPSQIIDSSLEFLDSLLEVMRQLRARLETKQTPANKLPSIPKSANKLPELKVPVELRRYIHQQ